MKTIIIAIILLAVTATAGHLPHGHTQYLDNVAFTFDAETWENTNNYHRIASLLLGVWPDSTNTLSYWCGSRPCIMIGGFGLANDAGITNDYVWRVTYGQLGRTNNEDRAFTDLYDSVDPDIRSGVSLKLRQSDVRMRTTTTSTTTTTTTAGMRG